MLAVAAVFIRTKWCVYTERRTENSNGEDVFALLPTGFEESLVKYHCSPWGSHACLVLPLTPIGSLELLLPG